MPAILSESEHWTESRVLDLPLGEDDRFERKGAEYVAKKDFDQELGKQLSAFANIGGGTIFLGIDNRGVIDGVPRLREGKKEPLRDWLEQRVPQLTDYPLPRFRVQEVVPSKDGTTIPPDRVVIAIDVYESLVAPHQVPGTGAYYWRSSGRSIPAPHYFLDAVRNRPHNAVLEISIRKVYISGNVGQKRRVPSPADLSIHLAVRNMSRTTMANRHEIRAHLLAEPSAVRVAEGQRPRVEDVSPILPGMALHWHQQYSVECLLPCEPSPSLAIGILRSLTLVASVSSDSYASEPSEFKFADVLGLPPRDGESLHRPGEQLYEIVE